MSPDNASYFEAGLTGKFLTRLGVSPRFHTPYASCSTVLVKCRLQTVKRVLGKLANDHARQWYEYLLLQLHVFMVFMGGRRMRGPISVLQESLFGYRNPLLVWVDAKWIF